MDSRVSVAIAAVRLKLCLALPTLGGVGGSWTEQFALTPSQLPPEPSVTRGIALNRRLKAASAGLV